MIVVNLKILKLHLLKFRNRQDPTNSEDQFNKFVDRASLSAMGPDLCPGEVWRNMRAAGRHSLYLVYRALMIRDIKVGYFNSSFLVFYPKS